MNKVCLITGSARGIGLGIAERFAAAKFQVVISDLRQDDAERTAQEIAKKYNVKTLGMAMDVTNEAAVNSGIARITKEMSKIDVVVNNAGLQIISPFEEFKTEDWKKLVDVHQYGSFFVSRAAMQQMKKNGGGSIIFIGSVHSVEASPKKAAYITAKHALLGMMRAIANEGAEYNVRANLVGPGCVKTELVMKQIPEYAKVLKISEKEVVEKILLDSTVDKQFTTVEDVAEVVFFFATFPTNALTGQSLIVSHGRHMQ
ncbi:MAG: 3-hydroxybutyrate dehydrogenase [Gammaproteobacteria bacterium]|nr:3-hydroxybutyrate dehydrogenase [Gammaproteobacteria bacterium]